MELTHGAEKTAVMFDFYGKGATKARHVFEETQDTHLNVITCDY